MALIPSQGRGRHLEGDVRAAFENCTGQPVTAWCARRGAITKDVTGGDDSLGNRGIWPEFASPKMNSGTPGEFRDGVHLGEPRSS